MASDGHPGVKPSLQISRAQAQAVIDRVTEHQTVTKVSAMHGGKIGAVYEVELAGAASPYVLKVYPETLHWKMRKEVFVLELLQDLSVPVPRTVLADDTRSLIGLNYVVMNKLAGDSLGRVEPSLPVQDLTAAYAQMGALLREIHHIPMDSFGYIGPQGVWTAYSSNRAYISFQFEKKLMEFAERRGDARLADRLRTFVAERSELLGQCRSASLCHYDFHAGNILAERKDGALQLSGIVDFEGAIAGDPLLDIAKTIYYFTPDDKAKKAALFAGYGTIDRHDVEATLALYRLYCTLELWCWLAQIGNLGPLGQLTHDLELCCAATTAK